jgi:Putative Flp pilus-assembly TadE/G-like
MNQKAANVSCEITGEAKPQPSTSLAGDEQGQISVFVVLCLIPFIFLVAFIFNTAKQTTRKIEMQGAADSAAVAGAVTMARGMNLMVLNNNGMADVLALMIFVRSMSNTATIMYYLNAVLSLVPYLGEYCMNYIQPWFSQMQMWGNFDRFLNQEPDGVGWRIMRALDGFNKLVRTAFPAWAVYQAAAYAYKNSADQFPYGFVLPGATGSAKASIGDFEAQPPLPTFPVARGPKQTIAERVKACQFGPAHKLAGFLFALFIPDPIQFGVAAGIYFLISDANLNALLGGTSIATRIAAAIRPLFRRIFRAALDFLGPLAELVGSFTGWVTRFVFEILGPALGIKFLTWLANDEANPRPMLLTEDPTKDKTDQKNAEASEKLRAFLQYLGFAVGKVPRGSRIGGERFLNTPNALAQVQFTYGQADVYNPVRWDMWTQDWRAQLTRSKLLDQKLKFLIQTLKEHVGGSALSIVPEPDYSFVNTH